MDNPNYSDLSEMQVKVYHDAALALEAHRIATANLSPYMGWMYFKKVGQREYLFHALDRKNNGRSLGARSPETEAQLAQWLAEKEQANAAFSRATQALDEQRQLTRALRLGRFPKVAAKLMRQLNLAGVAEHFVVVGTNALYAYESLAGVRFVSDLTATKDFDLLWDSRQRIVFMATDAAATEGGLMPILKKVDKTFTRNTERSFQAINADGFAIEVLRPELPKEPPLLAEGDGITPIHLKGLDYLLTAPLVTETVIAEDGYPLQITVPDPAVFALHKRWVADQPDRRADKARRDRKQAQAVEELIKERLPQYAFDIDRMQNVAPALLDYLPD